MTRLIVSPIVEGYGEVEAVPILLKRIWRDVARGEYCEVLRPIRIPRGKLIKDDELKRAVELGHRKLAPLAPRFDRTLVLLLVDANGDLPCELGPRLLGYMKNARADQDSACIVARVEYETWFVASAESLTDFLRLGADEDIPGDPESKRCGKGWIEKRFLSPKYSETIDQSAMTARIDLIRCQERSPSFAKLCRELISRGQPIAASIS